jgi:hypothetical protein
MRNITDGAVRWRKSSRSTATETCIELAYAGLVRDSKNPTGPALAVELTALIGAVKASRLDR